MLIMILQARQIVWNKYFLAKLLPLGRKKNAQTRRYNEWHGFVLIEMFNRLLTSLWMLALINIFTLKVSFWIEAFQLDDKQEFNSGLGLALVYSVH